MAAVVRTTIAPDDAAITKMQEYSSDDLIYEGFARSAQPEPKTWKKHQFTNIVVSSNVATVNGLTAHGLLVGQRITVRGATVDADLNSTPLVASVADANTLTFATSNVSDGTYTEATLEILSTAPRTSDPVWAIKKNIYSGGKLIRSAWAEGSGSQRFAWDSRASLAYQ